MKKEVLINRFVRSNFNDYPVVWMLTYRKSIHKIEAIQKRALRFMLNDYERSNKKVGKSKYESK